MGRKQKGLPILVFKTLAELVQCVDPGVDGMGPGLGAAQQTKQSRGQRL